MKTLRWVVICAGLLSAMSSQAAVRSVLHEQDAVRLKAWVGNNGITPIQDGFREKSREIDHRQTLHVRLEQTYLGYPVWGGNAILHIPKVSHPLLGANLSLLSRQPHPRMTGVVYERLAKDLNQSSQQLFKPENAAVALQAMQKKYKDKHAGFILDHSSSTLMVYVDKSQKAHWVYRVSFLASQGEAGLPEQPVYLVDALSLHVYKHWNNVKTHTDNLQLVEAGGYGGNYKVGILQYDGWQIPGHRGKLRLYRDIRQLCYFKNPQVTIIDFKTKKIPHFFCQEADSDHNNIYWNDYLGATNGSFSTNNDVMFAAQMVYEMYEHWYGVTPLKVNSKVPQLTMLIHLPKSNAYWDGISHRAFFGDGSQNMFPLTTLDVVGHEISHGFTQYHADLEYIGESGGINEAFSDMAGITLAYYVTKQVNWQVGFGVLKKADQPLRWMDSPAKDGHSIDHARDFSDELDVHYSSGVYNKAFYLLATTPNWGVRKAFEVMLHANRFYWTSTVSFEEGACGVVQAAKDLQYSIADVKAAFAGVGVMTVDCV